MAVPEGKITVAEAARRLSRSIEQVRRYLREGRLKGERIGQQWFIDEASLGVTYRPSGGRLQRVREPTAVMETPTAERERVPAGGPLIPEELLRRMDRLREEIRRKHGTFDIVEMVRRSREEH